MSFSKIKSLCATSILVFVVVLLAIIFTLLEPIIEHQYMDAFWTILGPVLFGAIALVLYGAYARRERNKEMN